MKKLFIFLCLFNLTNLTVLAECTIGYACSVKELKKQAREKIKENKKKENKNNLLKEINNASTKETRKTIKTFNQSI